MLYDSDHNPVYVGQTGIGSARLWSRLNDHERDHLWNRWVSFSWFGLRAVNPNGTLSDDDSIDNSFSCSGPRLLDELEGILINALEPRYNKQGPKWHEADEYCQEVVNDVTIDDLDERLETVENLLRKLLKEPH